jgi:hypothetical protein
MHAKYMHELCSLLMHIPIYYNVLVVIIMICNDLWKFSIDSPYFGYKQENPVLCIFTFQEPSQTQIDLRFFRH